MVLYARPAPLGVKRPLLLALFAEMAEEGFGGFVDGVLWHGGIPFSHLVSGCLPRAASPAAYTYTLGSRGKVKGFREKHRCGLRTAKQEV